MEVAESQRVTSDEEARVGEGETVKSEKPTEDLSLWSLRLFAL